MADRQADLFHFEMRSQKAMIFTAIGGFSLFMIGLLLMDYVPPPSPSNSPEWWANFWSENVNLKRLGATVGLLGATLTLLLPIPFYQQMRRVLGPASSVPLAQLVVGAFGVFCGMFLPLFGFSMLVYRPESHSPELAQAFTDFAEFPLMCGWPGALQLVLIVIAAFKDTEEEVFPRWYGYVVLWAAVVFVPGSFIYFFTSGPMAWNGLIAFWIGAGGAFAWLATSIPVLLRAADSQQRPLTATGSEQGVGPL